MGAASLAYLYGYLRSVTNRLVRRETSLIRTGLIILVNAFDKPLWASDLLLRLAKGLCHVGAVAHLGVVAHLNSLLSV